LRTLSDPAVQAGARACRVAPRGLAVRRLCYFHRMTESKRETSGQPPPDYEQRSIDPDTVMTAVNAGAAVVNAGVVLYTAHNSRPHEPPPPPPPSIELPPGVDGD
jgi:hypothetical protein